MGNVIDKGGSIGDVQGIECPAWVKCSDGERYDYDRVAYTDEDAGVPLSQMSNDEVLLAPGVIYKKADKGTPEPCCAGECEFCIGEFT